MCKVSDHLEVPLSVNTQLAYDLEQGGSFLAVRHASAPSSDQSYRTTSCGTPFRIIDWVWRCVFLSGCQLLMPTILASWEAEIRRISGQGQPVQIFLRPHLKNK
jgi:hypothetical protein